MYLGGGDKLKRLPGDGNCGPLRIERLFRILLSNLDDTN